MNHPLEEQWSFYFQLSVLIYSTICLRIISYFFSYEHRRNIRFTHKTNSICTILIFLLFSIAYEILIRGFLFGYILMHKCSLSYYQANYIHAIAYSLFSYVQNYYAQYDRLGHYRIQYITYECLTAYTLGYCYYTSGTIWTPIVANYILVLSIAYRNNFF